MNKALLVLSAFSLACASPKDKAIDVAQKDCFERYSGHGDPYTERTFTGANNALCQIMRESREDDSVGVDSIRHLGNLIHFTAATSRFTDRVDRLPFWSTYGDSLVAALADYDSAAASTPMKDRELLRHRRSFDGHMLRLHFYENNDVAREMYLKNKTCNPAIYGPLRRIFGDERMRKFYSMCP